MTATLPSIANPRRSLALLLLALGACQPALRPRDVASERPRDLPPPPTKATVSSTPVVAADPRLLAQGAPRVDDALLRTVTSVFGDSALAVDVEEEPSFDIDVRSYEGHARVLHYVQLFTGPAKERFTGRLARGTRYEPMIRTKLRAPACRKT